MKSTSVAPLKGIRREPARCNWRAWCTGLAALALLPFTVSAQTITSAVPGAISYQGKVSNAAGALVGAGTPVNRTIVFRIWSHQSNSTVSDLVYSEQQTVTISEGEFSVLIGSGGAVSGTPLGYNESAKGPPSTTVASAAVFGGASRYLGVTIDDPSTSADPEVSPRQQLVTSAFAFRAKYAETVGSNGTNTLTALDNGNVGIGTGNPGTRLEVAGNIRAGGAGLPTTSLSLLANHATNLASSIGYSNSIGTYSTDAAAGDTVMRTENGGKLLLQTGTGSSAVVIDASNKVGMGTAAPSAKLEVMSSDALNTLFVSNTGGGGGTQPALRVKMAATSGARNVIQAENNSGTIFVVKDTGYVGIANTSPSALLHIGTGANAGPGGLVVNTGWINTADPTEHRPLDVQVRGATALAVNSNGKVGIGTGGQPQCSIW